MPVRGYRKGVSDARTPLPCRLHTRLPAKTHAALMADAKARRMPAARLIRELVTAHYTKTAPRLPRDCGLPTSTLRELNRIGNNLNQITRQSHLMRLHLIRDKALACLDALERLLRKSLG